MLNRAALLPALLLAVSSLAAVPVSAATYKSTDGRIVVSATTIDFGASQVVARGKARVKTADSATKTDFEAEADKIVVYLYSSSTSKTGTGMLGSVKNVDLSGSVKLIYDTVDPSGAPTKTIATAKNAIYNGGDNAAYLNGEVKVTHTNPAAFEGPVVMTGDKATVNLKPNLGPEDFRFRVETPSGVSRIEATPKNEAQKK